MKINYLTSILCALLVSTSLVFAGDSDTTYQVEMQLRPRGEWRDGYRRVQPAGAEGSLLLEQRNRLGFTAQFARWSMKVGLQEVRSFFPQPTESGAVLGTYETWASWRASDQVEVIVGRQLVKFDDERIVGAVDWSQQGRFLDGVRLNWNGNLSKTSVIYTWDSPNSKTRTIVHHVVEANRHRIAGVFMDEANFGSSTAHTLTGGFNWKYDTSTNWAFGAEVDGQTVTGNEAETDLGTLLSLEAHHGTPSKGKTTLGVVRISGLHPSFGTNHRHYGWMDHFYVGSTQNGLFQARIGHAGTWGKEAWGATWGITAHHFRTENLDGLFANELDAYVAFQPNAHVQLHLGHSWMVATPVLAEIQGLTMSQSALQQWAWVSLAFYPKWTF